ncbi:hypothetical protein F3Y22_tig00112800pilonHSYRG00027 [Hibiscus syriacus]|uniref:RNase H type-1 domain-containing protein n=1 Tax=Hibiscus syriacus TaxID=106335 RepID=A0A6A2WT07_HIBSY|nr:hypothetical protein F3Y22_tig00112800pilonHSYRG00027 [Hibiscus syriacus]
MERVRRCLSSDKCWPLCGECEEPILHAIRDCNAARSTWLQILPAHKTGSFFNYNLLDWLELNLQNVAGTNGGSRNWNHLFGILLWRIWKNRCKFIFTGVSWSSEATLKAAQAWARPIFTRTSNLPNNTNQKSRNPGWIPPCAGTFKPNTDGAFNPSSKAAGGGGLIRNNNGEWIVGYSRNIGHCSGLQAELWALLDGLHLA